MGVAAVLAAVLGGTPASALAALQVSGNPKAVNITVQDTSIEEILSALSHEYYLQYNSSANLERQLTGTYQGSLQRVLTRVLEGYNFVVKVSGGQIELTVLGTQNVHETVDELVPVPVPSALSKSPPMPSSDAGSLVPELRPATVAPPIPLILDPAILEVPLPSVSCHSHLPFPVAEGANRRRSIVAGGHERTISADDRADSQLHRSAGDDCE